MPNPNGAVAGNAQNIPEAKVPRTRSTFPLNYHFFNTHRFGEYCPHFVAEMNKDEVFPLRSVSTLRTYTLKSPLLQNIKRNKDYFLIPMECILPLNWEKFFDNPVRGEDCPEDAGPSVASFWYKVNTTFKKMLYTNVYNTILADTSQATYDDVTQTTALFRSLILAEYFYSDGNLLTSLGCHGSNYFVYEGDGNFDAWFDAVVSYFVNAQVSAGWNTFTLSYTSTGGPSYTVYFDLDPEPNSGAISFRHALSLMRDDPTFVMTSGAPSGFTFTPGLQAVRAPFSWGVLNGNGPVNVVNGSNIPLNLSRLWAYQLSCAHYFTNDHIDFVYSAELFRQLIGNYIFLSNTNSLPFGSFFTMNGVKYQYDYLSAHFASYLITSNGMNGINILTTSNSAPINAILGYMSALFGYRRSLRYLDYFTGSRAQPLAVVGSQASSAGVNTNVAVNNNSVSVIDITRSIQAQRFLNSVNRVRHDFEGYLKGIFGGKVPAPDYHNPFYVAHTDDVIYGQETENTGAAQMQDSIAITTNLRARSNDFIFEVHSDRPCILLGISSYEIPRVYSRTIERPFFHINRFDWFNPFMQYIGDQPIYANELGLVVPGAGMLNNLTTWSYTLRHMEYKQRFNQCAGGFVHNLPGWLFIAKDEHGTSVSIGPDWLRSNPAEFDRFYISLTGWSLGSYFHFIVDDYNTCNASRPMAYAPSIL